MCCDFCREKSRSKPTKQLIKHEFADEIPQTPPHPVPTSTASLSISLPPAQQRRGRSQSSLGTGSNRREDRGQVG